MGILDIALKNGRHVLTIMLFFEKGEVSGEKFSTRDIMYIKGYNNVFFRVNVAEGGEERRYITKKLEFLEKNGKVYVRFVSRGESHEVDVSRITEVVSME